FPTRRSSDLDGWAGTIQTLPSKAVNIGVELSLIRGKSLQCSGTTPGSNDGYQVIGLHSFFYKSLQSLFHNLQTLIRDTEVVDCEYDCAAHLASSGNRRRRGC